MITASLRQRFTLAVAVALILALVAAGFGLNLIFDRAIRARAGADLEDQARIIGANLRVDERGQLGFEVSLQDTRFLVAEGGLFWQAGSNRRVELRSPSLRGRDLAWPPEDGSPGSTLHDLRSPDGRPLIAVSHAVPRPWAGAPDPVRIVVAMEEAELYEARTTFIEWLVFSLTLLGVALLVAARVFLGYSFAPFRQLQSQLAALHSGAATKMEGDFPAEVEPLVADLNALLAARDQDLASAQTRAADLAHGLKTPLAVLGATARSLRASGDGAHAREIEAEIARMNGTVKRELTRARAGVRASRSGHRAAIAPAAEKIVSALRRIGNGEAIAFALDAPADLAAAIAEEDLVEIVGNLLDNAAKWARGRVEIVARAEGDGVVLTIADDGPGLPEEASALAVQRGLRHDETKPGTGFGLAIVKDIAEAYGGALTLSRASLGGLSAAVRLPAVSSA